MKKLFSIVCCLCMAVAAFAETCSLYDAKINGICYNFVDNEAIVTYPLYDLGAEIPISGEYSGNIVIPRTVTYEGTTYRVTGICEYAFRNCAELKSISIPNSVTWIGIHAFRGCTSLTSVTIPKKVKRIEGAAFAECTSLSSVTIPNSVTEIQNYAFAGCSSLTSVTIPKNVTSIGGAAFIGCSSLNSVTIPNSVTEIKEDAFRGCMGLTSVTIPNSVIRIGHYAFRDCINLSSITIPNDLTSIEEGAFQACTGLSSVTIPNSVTEIREDAFRGCTGLTSVTIPSSVTRIGWGAFFGCSNLKFTQRITLFFRSLISVDLHLIFVVGIIIIYLILRIKNKGFKDAIKVCLKKKYASFKGRATRAEFWYFSLFYLLVMVGCIMVAVHICQDQTPSQPAYPYNNSRNAFMDEATDLMVNIFLIGIPMFWLTLALMCPSISVLVRRLHDTGRSGWWYWLGLIPIVGWGILFILALMPSEKEDNEYGPYIQDKLQDKIQDKIQVF